MDEANASLAFPYWGRGTVLCTVDEAFFTFPFWGRGTTAGVPRRELESVGGSRRVVDEANEISASS